MRSIAWLAVSLLFAGATTAAEPPPARVAELKRLLIQDCGSCHGLRLLGGLGPALDPATLRGRPDTLLVATILDGRPGTAMPPWRTLLSRSEVDWIVRELRAGRISR